MDDSLHGVNLHRLRDAFELKSAHRGGLRGGIEGSGRAPRYDLRGGEDLGTESEQGERGQPLGERDIDGWPLIAVPPDQYQQWC